MNHAIKVLFVCLGNICRSPTAEGVFQQMLENAGLADAVKVDSCGTADWHTGKSPDERTIAAAAKRGVALEHLQARQFRAEDLTEFDFVLAMDRSNLDILHGAWSSAGGTEPELFLNYAPRQALEEVPDPYYGGEEGFEHVLDLIEDAGLGLLQAVRQKLEVTGACG
ncbi:low molecular weight protein-tyrosine-phosphatase [Marinobacter sp. X15-166B]|uniref:low molecular weight protein-tyrosine-phosphatase n=1 Tax=Marinobacter sp. X15-166B TaxID=1897620 RepID=UPI00085C077E|nr:low molecular weight protein-tyrosine-phosphatase [Marinobacter sp. X15-166B]OEY67227.1 phosphotyrosine protein phosphatase [Marinobacter sp. X15-166B]